MPQQIVFDPANQLLVINGERAQVSPKAFAVLTHLYAHQHQLVSKEDLLTAVWPKVFVTDAVLKVAVGELRKVLNDHPKQPTYIETVHRRGYRFIGELSLTHKAPTLQPLSTPVISNKTTALLGRDAALQKLSATWALAQTGNKQVLFVTAEAGVGKTALVQGWLEQQFFDTDQPTPCLLASTACFDQYGSSEPYLPVLTALGNLLKGPQAEQVKQCLRQFAPSWLFQLPALLQAEEQAQLKQELFGASKQRMLREFVDFIEALSQQTPLLLGIEDLHWCDVASLDLILALAQRQSSGRYLLLGSFRSSTLQQDDSALKIVYSQLELQQQCQTLHLHNLDEAAIAQWLQRHLPASLQTEACSELFNRYTEGNPLLLNAALDYLQHSGVIPAQSATATDASAVSLAQIEQGISGGLKHLLSLKTAHLGKEDRQVLEAASVSAAEFATESLAAVLQRDVLDIEETCEDHLLHEQWLAPTGSQSWPDGSISESYRFWHQLYRQFFYETLSAARCRHYHLRFAERLLSGYQGKVSELAAQLAYHFEAGGDLPRALAFSQQASDYAAQCFAYREAISQLDKVIALSQQLDNPQTQLAARKQRCAYLLASGQLTDTISEYRSLIDTSRVLMEPEVELEATLGLADALFWIDRQACLATGKQAVALSIRQGNAAAQVHAQGKLAHFSSVIEGYQPGYAADYEAAFQLAHSSGDHALQCVHYPRHLYYLIIRARYQQANELATKALQLALGQGDAASYLSCAFFHAWALFYEGRWGEMLTVMDSALALATKNAHRPWVLHFTLQKAWLLLQATDYAGAKALCLPIYQQARLTPSGSLYFFSLIILLQISIATAEEHSQSQSYVTEVTTRLAAEPTAIDWVLRFPLQQGLAEFYLQQQQWAEAEAAAKTLKALADCSGEQTYAVMADGFMARSAIGQAQHAQAQTWLDHALAILQRQSLPVIGWRIYALRHDGQQTADIIQQLLTGLAAAPELAAAFTQSAPVQKALRLAH